MGFNPQLFNKVTRGRRLSNLAEQMGLDQDDFDNESDYDTMQKILSTKEYLRMSQEKLQPGAHTVPEVPALKDAIYKKVGLDEYRMEYWKKKGIHTKKNVYPKFGTEIPAEELFKTLAFAQEQMPAVFEDEFGNVWERIPQKG